MMRRRAESMMWAEPADPAVVRAYFAKNPPLSSPRAIRARPRACSRWATAPARKPRCATPGATTISAPISKSRALEAFGGLLTADDHKARMNMRLYAEDTEGGLRNANRAGGDAPAIAKARIAVIKKAGNAKAALDAVPAAARRDLGYIFSLAQWLRRADKPDEAGELILSAPRDPSQAIDTDQWWIERRLAARKHARPRRRREGLPHRPRRRGAAAGQLPRASTSSPPAGSRCASSTIRRRR